MAASSTEMKIRTSTQASRHAAAAKGLLPFVATAAIVAGVDAGLGGEAYSAPIEVPYNGTVYTLDTTTCFAPGTISGCAGATDFKTSSWFGNSQLAKDLSEATKDLLGLPNSSLGTGLGPNFAWQSGDPALFNESALPFDGFEWDPSLGKSYDRGGLWNSFTGIARSGSSTLAKEAAAPRPLGPILAANNGTNINTTASLAAKTLLPQFEGGTLVVSATNTAVADNFTLNDSLSNAIDAAGNSSVFSGIFSDKAGSKGNIDFKNTGTPGAVTALISKSTYSGITGIFGNAILQSGVDNALPVSTELFVERGGRFNLSGFNQTISLLSGSGAIELGSGTLTINRNSPSTSFPLSGAAISGSGGLIKDGAFTQTLNGTLTFTGDTRVKKGTLNLLGSSTSNTLIEPGATLGGTGVIKANVFNFGTVSPGLSIGTLTIDGGSYLQDSAATLAIEVAGAGASDLLRLTGSGAGQAIILEGNLKLSSFQGAPITPGVIYTAVSVPAGTVGGDPSLSANTGGVAGTSGYAFVRDEDADFTQLANGTATPDPTKLQFGWIQLKPGVTPSSPPGTTSTATTPGLATINVVKSTGGALTQILTAPAATLIDQCTANTGTGTAFSCQTSVLSGGSSGLNGSNTNNISAAKVIDAGISSVYSAVVQGTTGGTPIPTVNGTPSGYTSNQALAGAVTPDFVTVYGALFSIPTRAQLNQALHSVTAEPYASMQSVALEAMEQFRQNSLALSDGDRAIRLFTETEVCRAEDGSLIPSDSSQRPSDCQPRKLSQASRWSLLIDATNTQASLEGTNDLASLDYNIFQSTYGLQYDASKQWSIGAAFGYGQANLYNYQYANATINSDTYGGSFWGVYRPANPWKLTGLIGYTNFQYDSNRNINFGGLNRAATANWSGNGFTTALEAEYDWTLSVNKADRNAIRMKPNTYVAYSLHSQGDITESGAQSLNLAVDSHTADSFVYGIGFTLETPIQLANSTRLIPRLSVGYEHDFNANTNEEHELSSSFAEVPALGSIDVLGQNRGANDLNLALNVELETSDQFSLYAGVGGSFWSNGNELNYGGGLRWRFGGAPKSAIAKAQLQPPAPVEPSLAPTSQPQAIRSQQ
jgi:autotransporter-associated beta strand protein